MKVCRVAEIRQLDRRAVEEYGVPWGILMENAGEATYHAIRLEFGTGARRFAVLCGPGNNGGDGFVVARHLHAAGADVAVAVMADREKYRGEAMKNLDILSRFPLPIKDIKSIRQLRPILQTCDVIVDALLGTGLDRDVEGLLKEAIDLASRSGKKVFAIDIPSGVSGDTGQIMGAAVKADVTITFGLPKVGNLLYPGYGLGGKLYVAPISYPQPIATSEALKIELARPVPLPDRHPDTSKMDYGPVLVIAGAASYFWAPHASAYSFLKAGGGYVYLACPASIAASVAKEGREVVIQPQQETSTGSIAMANADRLVELSERMRMVVMGPGLSLNQETQEMVRVLAKRIRKPLLIDGDGITAIAAKPEVISKRKAPTILTPHTGEMGRILGKERQAVEADRVSALQDACARLNACVVLKGAHSLVGFADGKVHISVSGATGGRAGMATAGSGDVLNGTIAAMYCLGLELEDAVLMGVFVHGLSGDLAAKEKGPDGMTAQDILSTLPLAVRYYRDHFDEIAADYYGAVHVL